VDFDLSEEQSARLDALRVAVAAQAPRHASNALPGSRDDVLVAAIRSNPELTGAHLALLDRVLLVEEAARLGAACNPTTVLLVEPLADGRVVGGAVAVSVAGPPSPIRDGATAVTMIELGHDHVRWMTVPDSARSIIDSGVGSSYAVVSPDTSTRASAVAWGAAGSPLAHYRLGLAAEIAGAARAALDHTATYLTQRRAFGTTLSTFQALRHRLSELAVDVAGTSALVRQAAWHNDAVGIAGAVSAAVSVAAAAPPELHQMCGARGFTSEFGVSRWTMLLQALRIELGGAYESAVTYADARWPDPTIATTMSAEGSVEDD
jgi:hypothetical protein